MTLEPFKQWYAKTKNYGGTKKEWLKLKQLEKPKSTPTNNLTQE